MAALTSDTLPPVPIDVVTALRATRRARRLGDLEWGGLAYRVYTTALGALVLVVFLSGLIGDRRLDPTEVLQFGIWAPRWAGTVLAAAALLGVRSGSRGGPLALEAADVQHLLLAPVDRSAVLRRPALSTLAYGCLAGAAAGALFGQLASQRLPGGAAGWIVCGALYGVLCAAAFVGSALLRVSRALPGVALAAVALVLAAWSLFDVVAGTSTAPTTFAGELVTWPLELTPWPLIAVLGVAAITTAGVARVGGLDMEAALRRTTLVSQLRFAVTQQDLRSVLLLRRQLASEVPRRRPWPLRLSPKLADRFPVVARDVQSLARWPLVRVARVLVLCVMAGLALRATYSGTTPLVLVAGIATFVAGLDAIEPLAQELDHPTLTGSFPVDGGAQRMRHLVVPTALLMVNGAVALGVAYLVAPDPTVLAVGAATVLSGAVCAVAAAATSVLSEDPMTSGMVSTPEVAGPRFVLRIVWPPLLATVGVAPVLAAQRAARAGADLTPAVVGVAVGAILLASVVFAWIRSRDDIHASIAAATGGTTS